MIKIKFFDLALIAFYTLLIFSLYGNVLNGFFRWDDWHVLHSIVENSWYEYFYDPEKYQYFSAVNLTPFIMFSFYMDYQIFGMFVKGFYLHQLFVITAILYTSTKLLNLWINNRWAIMAAIAFCLGSPVAVLSQQLMARHYLEGLLFSILAAYCYFISLKRNQYNFALLGAFLYFLAISCKEIYVPLVAILISIDANDWQAKIQQIKPFVVVAVFYMLWRKWMLGTFIGGYSGSYYNDIPLTDLVNSMGNIVELFYGGNAFIFLLSISLFIFVLMIKRQIRWYSMVIVLFAVLMPLLPLNFNTSAIHIRYVLHVWWFFIIGSTYMVSLLWQNQQSKFVH